MRFLLAALLALAAPAFGATITITANTNWSAIATGSGPGGQPNATDIIIVKNNRTLTVNVASGTVGQITLGGGNPSGGPGTLSFNAGSAATITSASGQSGLLVLGGGGQAGNLNMNSGGTLTLNGFTSNTVGTFTRGSGTIVLTGTNTLPVAAAYATYNNLSVSANTTSLGQNTTVAGNLNISGGALNTSTRTLSVTGTTAVTGTLTLTNTTTLTGALTVNSGGTLSITSATGNKTFGAVSINTGGAWNSAVAGNVFIGGNFANNGTFTSNLATYTFNGAAAQTITGTNGGSTSFAFLTINNANGVTLTGTHNVTVATLLTLVAGKISTGSNLVYVSNGSNVSGAATGRFIEGNLSKPFSSGSPSRLFEVGGNAGTGYAPVSITFASISVSGDVTVSSTAGTHPQIASSGLDDTTPALLNRYWTVTNNGVAFSSYDASFSYPSGEIDPGASASTFLAVRFASGAWNPTTLNGTPTTTTLLITNETGFGDFAIGNTGASSGTIGRFNAYDPPPVTPSGSVTGNIRTKVAGVLFTLTIVHLNNKGTGLQNMNDDFTAELLDGSPTGGTFTNNCSSNWTTVIASVAGNMSGGTSSASVNFTVANVWRDVRVRVTRAGGSEIGCSTDNFAIRPASISVLAKDATWQTAGTMRTLNNTAATGGVVHAASVSSAATPRPFTVEVTVSPASATNYNGATLAFKTGSPACVLPAGCSTGTLTFGAWTQAANVLTAQAHYSQTGTFSLELEDATYADVDTADTAAAVRTLAQSPAAVEIGRFVPDRFVFSGANTPQLRTFGNTCASRSFTYIGQPFGFVSGLAPTATLSAVNAGGGITSNYTLNTALSQPAVTETFTDASAPAGAPLDTSGITAFSANAAGGTTTYSTTGNLSYTRNATTPVSPFNAAITLTVGASDATEIGTGGNGTISATALVFNSGPSAIAFDAGNQLRYGVVRLIDVFAPLNGNATGKAPVGIEAQHWNGTGFVTNTADNCSSFGEKNFVLYAHRGAASNTNVPTPTAGSNGAVTMGMATLAAGIGRVDISAPSPAVTAPGNLRVCIDLDPTSAPVDPECVAVTPVDRGYLQGRWAGTGTYNKDPNATVGFGVFGAQPRQFILFRENY